MAKSSNAEVAWWRAVAAAYLLRPSRATQALMDKHRKTLAFKARASRVRGRVRGRGLVLGALYPLTSTHAPPSPSRCVVLCGLTCLDSAAATDIQPHQPPGTPLARLEES